MSHYSDRWRKQPPVDPVPCLLDKKNEALTYFVKRDLLDENVGSVEQLWTLPAVQKLLKRQQLDGSWKYPGGGKEHLRSHENYNQLETFRNVAILVEQYGFTKKHPAMQHAAEYLFSFQTNEGDIRGIYGTQYATTYSSAIMELLIKAGYQDDSRIEKGFQWLLSCRQQDGGWAIPLRTVKMKYYDAIKRPDPVQPDRTKPFSHLITGMVLRAFAAHPTYRKAPEAYHAGDLLASRMFKSDKYSDRRTPTYWTRGSFPFWFTDVVTTLDSLSQLGFSADDLRIRNALDWFIHHQNNNGLFIIKILRGKDKDLPYWISLAICRIFKRFYE